MLPVPVTMPTVVILSEPVVQGPVGRPRLGAPPLTPTLIQHFPGSALSSWLLELLHGLWRVVAGPVIGSSAAEPAGTASATAALTSEPTLVGPAHASVTESLRSEPTLVGPAHASATESLASEPNSGGRTPAPARSKAPPALGAVLVEWWLLLLSGPRLPLGGIAKRLHLLPVMLVDRVEVDVRLREPTVAQRGRLLPVPAARISRRPRRSREGILQRRLLPGRADVSAHVAAPSELVRRCLMLQRL